jgi:hypothetical protein
MKITAQAESLAQSLAAISNDHTLDVCSVSVRDPSPLEIPLVEIQSTISDAMIQRAILKPSNSSSAGQDGLSPLVIKKVWLHAQDPCRSLLTESPLSQGLRESCRVRRLFLESTDNCLLCYLHELLQGSAMSKDIQDFQAAPGEDLISSILCFHAQQVLDDLSIHIQVRMNSFAL